MSLEQAAINAVPSSLDIDGVTNTLNDPTQILRILDRNNDGRITKEDLELLFEQFGINGMAAKVVSKYVFNQLDANGNGTIEASDLTNAGDILWSLLQKKQSSGGN
jgi:Ca2+-binding EF-hand superfamily protein